MKPPYELTPKVLSLSIAISEKVGAATEIHVEVPRALLRKENRIRTIHSSLAIEGNTLSPEQVTALLENKRVIGPPKDIQEVKNAIRTYEMLDEFKPYEIKSFLSAHRELMLGLLPEAGSFRSKATGVFKGNELAHLAPPARRVPLLMDDLFRYVSTDPDPILIKSCVFHYEMEFIHPFADGNGRMGRLWQTVLLKTYNPVFAWLPVEAIIRERQMEYYDALQESDKVGHSTQFLEFMLSALNEALAELIGKRSSPPTAEERIVLYKNALSSQTFTRKDYLQYFKTLSTATASRDLSNAVDKKILKKTGDKNTTRYEFR